jgi:protein involved in polysaccharide export with SLBB domain
MFGGNYLLRILRFNDRSAPPGDGSQRIQMYRFIFLFFLVSSAQPLFGQSIPMPETPPMLQSGDSLRITVWQEPTLSGAFEVNPSGRIQHPLYSDLQVAGVPLSEFEGKLRSHLLQFRENPRYSFEPLFTVVVSGEVIKGGVLTLGPGVTLARAMTMAAPTERARLDRVRLIRDRKSYEVDFADPQSDWVRATVRSGDHIVVESRLNVFRDIIGPVTGMMGAVTSMVSFLLFMTGQF